MGLRYPALRPERRGTFTGQCCGPLCPGESASHLADPEEIAVPLFSGDNCKQSPKASARLGAWPEPLCRNAPPPELSLPGPSVTGRYLPALAAQLSRRKIRARISGRARTRPGRIE